MSTITRQNPTLFTTQQWEIICCGKCDIEFGMPKAMYERVLRDRTTWYCPAGHPRVFNGRTEEQKLREQLSNARQRERAANARAQSWRDQAETAEHRRRAEKAAKTRLKKRIAAGVCPCCNRSFMDLQRHMQGQHPGYTVEG